MSTLIGNYFGKHKLPINKNKTFEGSSAFLVTAFFALLFFTDPIKAAITALIAMLVEMAPYIDDNITIPLTVGIVLAIIS